MDGLPLKLFAIFTMSILVFAGTNSYFQSVYAQKLSKSQILQCEHLYYNYKKFGEAEFLKRYAFKSFIRDCVKLYKDPNWTFNGKDKIDQYFTQSTNVNSSESYSAPNINLKQKLKVGNTRFLASFSVCATKTGTMPNFLLSSDKEQYVGSSQKLISANTCRTFSAYFEAQNPSTISVEHVADLSNYPNLKIKRL